LHCVATDKVLDAYFSSVTGISLNVTAFVYADAIPVGEVENAGFVFSICGLDTLPRLGTLEFTGVPLAENLVRHPYDIGNTRLRFIVPREMSNPRTDWNNTHALICDNTLALAPLQLRDVVQLPVYVLLWIFDWLEPMIYYPEWRHVDKVRLIEGLVASRRRVLQLRDKPAAAARYRRVAKALRVRVTV
jgi:hypothetical protein